MSVRLQVTIPDEMEPLWRNAAAATGVSLSNWITMRVNRPDTRKVLGMVLEKLEEVKAPPPPRPLALTEEEDWLLKEQQYSLSKPGRSCSYDQALRIAVRRSYAWLDPAPHIVAEVLGEEKKT